MERARSQGGGRFVKFEPSADGPMQEQLLLEQDFRSAIGTSQLFMAYQPICHVATGKISGFESLMRWNSPARGSVPPGVFIPIDRKSTRLNSSHTVISYAVFCLKKKDSRQLQHTRESRS